MADMFGADPAEARRIAGELAAIRAGLDGTVNLTAGAGATGSGRVQRALHRFSDDSAESRQHMGELLGRASGMLTGLADGSAAVDQALAEALEPEAAAS